MLEYVGEIAFDQRLTDKDLRYVVYGAGRYGKRLYQYLKEHVLDHQVVCFCDTDSKKQNTSYDGKEIIAPQNAIQKYPSCLFLVGGIYKNEIMNGLIDSGVSHIHLFL